MDMKRKRQAEANRLEKEAKIRRITSLEEENARLKALLEEKDDDLLSTLDMDLDTADKSGEAKDEDGAEEGKEEGNGASGECDGAAAK